MDNRLKKFVEISRSDVNSDVESTWFNVCCQHQRPFIVIKSHGDYADVHWDYITLAPATYYFLNREGAYFCDAAVAIYDMYSNKHSSFNVNNNVINFNNLGREEARELAAELYELIQAYAAEMLAESA